MSTILNRRPARSTKNHTRPRLEALEDRLVPASVTFVNDNWNLIADNSAVVRQQAASLSLSA